MVLQFTVGNNHCHHIDTLVEETNTWLKMAHNHKVFYIVPNHIKFETEVAVLTKLRDNFAPENQKEITAMGLQVFSFSRLAWYFLQNTVYYPKNHLSEVGNAMLIRKALKKSEDALYVFRGEVDKTGFVDQLASLFKELDQGEISLEDLLAFKGEKEQRELDKKMTDIEVIYQQYLLEKQAREFTDHVLLKNLKKFLQQEDLSDVLFIFSGFTRFAAEEKSLVETLMGKAGKVIVDIIGEGADLDNPQPYDLFYDSSKFYNELLQLARQNNVHVLHNKKISDRNDIAEDLQILGEYWEDSCQLSPLKKFQLTEKSHVKIWKTANIYDEVAIVASEIHQLVASGNYRYRDILVLSRDFKDYQSTVEPIFRKNAIPYYLDETVFMKNHPLVVFFQSLFMIFQGNFRYEDIFRFLRTQLFLPTFDEEDSLELWRKKRLAYQEYVDLTENVALAYGYEGFYWTQERDWQYVHYDYEGESYQRDENQWLEEISNSIRGDLRETLLPFYQKLKNAKTGSEGAEIFYQFIEEIHLREQISMWRDLALEANDLDGASIQEETWQAFIQLLDEYVSIFGEEPFEMSVFEDLFHVGLETVSYGRVPASLDQVVFSPLDRLHVNKGKVTFIIGATDQSLPKKIENNTLLSDREREAFNQKLEDGKYLLGNSRDDLSKEPFIAYLAFTSSLEKLYLSYPITNEQSDSEAGISPYVARIAKDLELPIEKVLAKDRVSTYPSLISSLMLLERESMDNQTLLAPFWQRLKKIIQRKSSFGPQYQKIAASFESLNIPENLNSESVSTLYGDTLFASVSRFEDFYTCEYKYFLNYGLRLRERDVLTLSPMTMGNFFHSALDLFFKIIKRKGLVLSDLSHEMLGEVSHEVLLETLGEERFSILNTTKRMNYIQYQLSKTIRRVLWAIQKQSQQTGMSPVDTEILFGQIAKEQGLPPLTFETTSGQKIYLRGKIDRLDITQTFDTAYLSVVDYKSSSQDFKIGRMYYGLAMQMITYLDVAFQNAARLLSQNGYPSLETVKPGGAFYYHVKNPVIKRSDLKNSAENQLLEAFKFQGIILDDTNFVKELDTSLSPGETSLIHYVKIGKKAETPQISSKERSFQMDEMQLLMNHNRKNIQNAGEKIFHGEVQLNPVRIKQNPSCTYCNFRSVCLFDSTMPENNYVNLLDMKKNEALDKMNPASEEKGEE